MEEAYSEGASDLIPVLGMQDLERKLRHKPSLELIARMKISIQEKIQTISNKMTVLGLTIHLSPNEMPLFETFASDMAHHFVSDNFFFTETLEYLNMFKIWLKNNMIDSRYNILVLWVGLLEQEIKKYADVESNFAKLEFDSTLRALVNSAKYN